MMRFLSFGLALAFAASASAQCGSCPAGSPQSGLRLAVQVSDSETNAGMIGFFKYYGDSVDTSDTNGYVAMPFPPRTGGEYRYGVVELDPDWRYAMRYLTLDGAVGSQTNNNTALRYFSGGPGDAPLLIDGNPEGTYNTASHYSNAGPNDDDGSLEEGDECQNPDADTGSLQSGGEPGEFEVGMGGNAGSVRMLAPTLTGTSSPLPSVAYKMPYKMLKTGGGIVQYNSPTNPVRQLTNVVTTLHTVSLTNSATDTNALFLTFAARETGQVAVRVETRKAASNTFLLVRHDVVAGTAVERQRLEYSQPATNRWRVAHNGGLLVELTEEDWTNNRVSRYHTKTDAAGNTLQRFVEVHTNHPVLGRLLLERTDYSATTTVARSSSYTYWSDAASSNTLYYGQLASITNSDGSWERRAYNPTNGMLTNSTRPWLDGANNARVEESVDYGEEFYSGPYPQRRITTYADDTQSRQIGKEQTYVLVSVLNDQGLESRSRYRYTSSSQSLLTDSKLHPASFPQTEEWLRGRPIQEQQPDGTVWTNEYSREGDLVVRTRTQGTQASPGGVAGKTGRETTVENTLGQILARTNELFTDAGFLTLSAQAYGYDDAGHLTNLVEDGVQVYSASYANGLMTAEDDRRVPALRTFAHDAYGRLQREVVTGWPGDSRTNEYYRDALGRVTQQVRRCASGTLSSSVAYDWAGRAIARTDEQGLLTTTAYTNNGLRVVTTMPGGAQRIVDSYPDGRVRSVQTTGEDTKFYSYGVVEDGGEVYLTESVASGSTNSLDARTTWRDIAGRVVRETLPAFGGGGTYALGRTYNASGHLVRVERGPGMADQVMGYDEVGNLRLSGLTTNASGLEEISSDPITETVRGIVQDGGSWFQTTEQWIKSQVDAATSNRVSATWALIGAGPFVSEQRSWDNAGNRTVVISSNEWASLRKTVTTVRPGVATAEFLVHDGFGQMRSASHAGGGGVTNTYDGFGRLVEERGPEFGSRIYRFDATGRLDRVTDAFGKHTTFAYDPTTGRRTGSTDPLGNTVYTAYDAAGRVTNTWGATYPVAYVFDGSGRMTEMKTWRTAGGASATTRWNYDPATGLLTNKVYADGLGPSYRYTTNGLLAERRWVRTNGAQAVTSAYTYDPLGRLVTIQYSDATPDVTYAYTRDGRLDTVLDAAGTTVFSYDPVSLLETQQTVAGSALIRVRATNGVVLGREVGLVVNTAAQLSTVQRTFDTESRLASVAFGSVNSVYTYSPGHRRPAGVTHYGPTGAVLTSGWGWDVGGRIAGVTNTLPATGQSFVYGYTHDDAGRRTRIETEAGASWNYGYNAKGEVTSGVRRTSQGVDLPGQGFQYAFDEIGNRTGTRRDQDRVTTWTANDLNQYTARQVSSNLHVFGRAVTSRTVSVEANNGAMTAAVTRVGAYFHGALTVTNTFAPVWADILVRALATNGLAETNNFQRLVEQTPEAFAHDADGNLAEDGIWAYSWDAENRLTQAVARAAAVSAGAPNLKLVFAYDHMSRRIAKTVSAWTNGAWTQTSSRAFIYDGWNLAAETGGVYGLQTYAWGLDLSGTPQGAGGVGGLLGATLATTNGYVVGCDANGNVMLAVLDNGALQSQMEYGPFGEAVRVTEYAAPGANPFRFSTKYEDVETGLLYYGFRYYDPPKGRWLSLDPIGFEGGYNLYGFCYNSAANYVDSDGNQALLRPQPIVEPILRVLPRLPPEQQPRTIIRPIGGPQPISGIQEPTPAIPGGGGIRWGDDLKFPDPETVHTCKRGDTPPKFGRCSPKQHHDLHKEYSKVCKQEFSCKFTTDCNIAWRNYLMASECVRKRLDFEHTCFPEWAPSSQSEDYKRAVNICIDRIQTLCPLGLPPIS